MAPIDPVAAVSSALSVNGPGAAIAQPTEAAVKKFEALMARSETTIPTHPTAPAAVANAGAANPVMRALSAQESVLREISLDIQDFKAAAPGLSANEALSRTIEIGHTVAQAMTALTATTSITQGANKGLQSLLKNQ
jgi:hypothetical protein